VERRPPLNGAEASFQGLLRILIRQRVTTNGRTVQSRDTSIGSRYGFDAVLPAVYPTGTFAPILTSNGTGRTLMNLLSVFTQRYLEVVSLHLLSGSAFGANRCFNSSPPRLIDCRLDGLGAWGCPATIWKPGGDDSPITGLNWIRFVIENFENPTNRTRLPMLFNISGLVPCRGCPFL